MASIEDAPPHLAAQLERLVARYGATPLNGGGRTLDGSSASNRRKHLLYLLGDLNRLNRSPGKLEELKPADIDAVVRHWIGAGLTRGTLASRMTSIRALGRWIGKPDLGRYRMKSRFGLEEAMLGASQPTQLDELMVLEKIEKVRAIDESVALQIELIWRFGITLPEAILLRPNKDFRDGQLYVVKGAPRNIPRPPMPVPPIAEDLVTRAQAYAMNNRGFLYPSKKTFGQVRKRFYALLKQAGFTQAEGLTATSLRRSSERLKRAGERADRELGIKRLLSAMEGLQSNQIRQVEHFVRTKILFQEAV